LQAALSNIQPPAEEKEKINRTRQDNADAKFPCIVQNGVDKLTQTDSCQSAD